MNRSSSRSHNNVWRTLNVCCSPAIILLSLSSFICFWLDNTSNLHSGTRRNGITDPSIPQLVHAPAQIVTTPSPLLQQPPALATKIQTPVRTTPAPESSDDDDVDLAVRGGLLIPDLDKVEVKKKAKPKEEKKQQTPKPEEVEYKYEEIETERGSEHVDENNIQFKAEWHGAQLLVHTLLATKLTLKKDDVSWVTQLTADRLDGFTQMMARWKGPITAALYCRDLKKDLAAIKPLRDRVDFHLILADLHPGRLYPVNTLRNVAIDNCRTQYISLVDADFVPNVGLYEALLPKIPKWKGGENAVYVLAAFQLQGHNKVVPKTKPELLEMWGKGQLSAVHPEPGRDIAHKHTNYEHWKIASDVYEAKYQLPYEPYFVADKQRMPRYDASFLGYGNDKTGHCYEIFKAGIKYMVLPDAFVFHMDHPRGDWLNSDIEFALRNPATLGTFFLEMETKYPATAKPRVITPVAGRKGENCTSACKRSNMACHPGYHKDVNNCEVLKKLFGERCNNVCHDNMFGNDLPAFNNQFKMCLLNQKPTEYKISCTQGQADSERVCPCGDVVQEWLTHEWITQQGLYDYKKNKK